MRGGRLAVLAAATLAILSSCSAASTASHVPPVGRSGGIGPIPTVQKALPRIEKFVEQERGLTFKRAVKVKLLAGKAFVKQLDKGDKGPTKHDVEQAESVLASTGLISPKVDLVKAFKTANDSGTLGFYDFKTKRLYVRGTRATPGVRAVLSHELTHALTDQWFGLDRPKLDKSNQELSLGFTALTEGDAERTRVAYEHNVLTPDQRKIAEKEENGGGGPPPHVPLIVLEAIGFPYAVGPSFVSAIVADGGIAALNRAYRHPPVSSEQLLDPAAYENHDLPKRVATPPSDGTRLDHGDLGEIGLLLMFERGLTRGQAQAATTGWGGDQYASWRSGSGWCLRDSVVMDYGLATQTFQTALEHWVATRAGKAKIEHLGTTTTFLTCSEGARI